MNFDEFKQEVNNNRPRLALVYLVPVLEELIAANKAMAKEISELKSSGEPVKETAPAKKAPAKKTAAKKSAAKTTKQNPEEEEKNDTE